MSKIIYTHTDEAPALATYSFLPIIEAYAGACGVDVETRDISLAGRLLAAMNEHLPADQRVNDALAELGELAKTRDANIIKLPNISASIPQLEATIKELQAKGLPLADYPDEPSTPQEEAIKAAYDSVKGSAVNPVLREGNSDRRAPEAVKAYARANPHRMGEWPGDSKTHVATMDGDDFASNEQSVTVPAADTYRIEHVASDGTVTVMKDAVPVTAGEVVDASFMSASALRSFLDAQIADSEQTGVMFSLHLKATMMKVSDPIIFGHAVKAYFADVFDRYAAELEQCGANPNNGLGGMLSDLEELPADKAAEIRSAIEARLQDGPPLAYVNSDRGISNLHVPSDIIIDASMPRVIRDGGKEWGLDGELHDTKATIPESSYADLYSETIQFCKTHGAFDPTTMGTVPNVGLMAQKAEEYGSHDKTFEVPADGTMRVVNAAGEAVMSHEVAAGDIWRACQARDAAIRDWVSLAVRRARATGWPTIFWLDATRAHDAQLIEKVNTYLAEEETDGLDIRIMDVADATRLSLERAAKGENTISVTGNVLRDYLTDLFPILELGTSAKMLSIVPLMNGGGLFETGAGGSAPKHVQQFTKENHLRWDSLGEFLALAVSLDHLADTFDNPGARVMGAALDRATETLLKNGKSPSRKVNELDNRGSHFYLALYWAQELAAQTEDGPLAERFAPLAQQLADAEDQIVTELNEVQGQPMDIGGYYAPDADKATAAMRPSATFNEILDSL